MKHLVIAALTVGAALLPTGAMAMSPTPTPPSGCCSGGGSSGGSGGGTSPTPVPEPASMLVLGSALGALGVARKFGQRKK